jgi:hypothetical protein
MQQTGGFPSYIQSNSSGDSYNYSGLSPEIALEEQALNRKQQIANALMQRGLQPLQGQMVGGWYVPASPIQGLAQLAQAGIGAYATNRNDKARAELTGKSSNMLAEAMKKYRDAIADKTTTTETPLEGPGQPVRTASPGDGFSPEELRQPTALYGTTGEALDRLDQSRPSAFFKEGPRPTATSTTVTPRTPEEKRQALIEHLAISTHPQAQKLGQLMLQHEETAEQRGLDREVRREGIQMQAQNTLAQLENNLLTRQMMIDQSDKNSTRHDELVKQQQAEKIEADKWKAKLDFEARQRHDETLKTIAGGHDAAKNAGKTEGVEKGKENLNLLLGQLHDYYDQLHKSGGITSTDSGPLENVAAKLGSSSIGQAVGGAVGTKNQSVRDSIAQQRPLLMQAIMKANNMTAKSMDSNVELKLWLATATDPTLGYEANKRALDMLEKLYGGGSAEAVKSPAQDGPGGASGIRKYNPSTGKIE